MSRKALPAQFLIALVLSISFLFAPTGPIHKRDSDSGDSLSGKGKKTAGALEVPEQERNAPPKHSRPEWWPFDKGPRYGIVGVEGLSPQDRAVIYTKAGDVRLDGGLGGRLPESLRAHISTVAGRDAPPHVYLIALPTAAAYQAGSIRKQIESQGAELVDFVPREAVILRVPPQFVQRMLDSPTFEHVEAFHPALKIDFLLGQVPFWNKKRADSPVFELTVVGHRGESPEELIRDVERVGATVRSEVTLGARTFLHVEMHRDRVFALARLARVVSIEERREYLVMTTTAPPTLQTGRYNDYAVPFFEAGVDGGGNTRCMSSGPDGVLDTLPLGDDRISGNGLWLVGGGDNICNTLVSMNDDVVANSGVSLVPAQLVCAADNGVSLDAAGLSHSLTEPCIGGDCTAAGGSMGATVGNLHRKVQSYTTGFSTDGSSSGDLTNCDSAASGSGSHGNLVVNLILGNPSNGIEGLGITRDDTDIDEFDEANLPLDGVARGARLIFQDISITSAGSVTPCNAGSSPGAQFVDRNNVVPGSITQRLLDCGAAQTVVFPFGVPNFDNSGSLNFDIDTGHYLSGALQVDTYLFENRAQSVFLPTGNDGANPHDGTDIYPDDPGHPACQGPSPDPGCPFTLSPTRIQVNNLATAKNAVTVGAVRADALDFFGNFDQTENTSNFTSKGPASVQSLRIAPLVMGQGSDFGGKRLEHDPLFNSGVVLRSSDNDNAGAVEGVVDEGGRGTSLAAGVVAGAGALVRDYFAQGLYPSGSPTVDDRAPVISGALVRGLLAGSANFGSAFVNNLTRFNNEQGFGRVELGSMLPLEGFHGGPIAGDPRRALRPPDGGTPPTVPTVPTSLLVFDEFLEGGSTWSKNGLAIATGVAVLEEGLTTLETTVSVADPNEQLRVALSWYDPASALDGGGVLINDLDLEVESPSGLVYLGNNFVSEFSIATIQGGVLVDSDNPVEAVILNRPVETGTWKVRVQTSDPSVIGANNAVCTVGFDTCDPGDVSVSLNGLQVCTSGLDGVCNTVAGGGVQLVSSGAAPLPFGLSVAGGFLHFNASTARLNQNRYDCAEDLHFTILDSSAGVTAEDIKSLTTLRVLRDGATVDQESGAWDGEVLFVVVNDGVGFSTLDPVPVQLLGSAEWNDGVLEVQSGDRIELEYADGDSAFALATAVVDCEPHIDIAMLGVTGINQQFLISGGCDVGFGGTFQQGDLYLDAGENVVYQVAFQNSGPDVLTSLSATLTCIDPDPGDLVNPCDVLSPLPQTVGIGDLRAATPTQPAVTSVSFNLEVAPDLTTQLPLSSDRVVKLQTSLSSVVSDVEVGSVTFTFEHPLQADEERLHYSTDYPEGTQACDAASANAGTRCLTDGDCIGGVCTDYFVAVDLNRDGRIDLRPVSRELISYEPITYDVSTGMANRNITTGNADLEPGVMGNPQRLDADGPDDRFGKRCFTGPTSSATPCQDDGDCAGAETCRTDDPAPFSMDGVTSSAGSSNHADAGASGQWASFENPLSDPGFPTPTEIWISGGGGGCGFQSQDRAASTFRRAGVWHAGSAADPGLADCPDYPTPGNPTTVEGAEFLRWLLLSPVIQKVNTAADSRGFEFTVSMERTAWNENVQLQDTSVYVITQLDNDVRTAANVDPDQDPQQIEDRVSLFRPDRYVNTLLQGPLFNVSEGQNRFGGSREVVGAFVFSRLDPDDSLGQVIPVLTGDEVGVARTLGGLRAQQVANVCQDPAVQCDDYRDPDILASLPHPVLDSVPGGPFDENDDWIDLPNDNILCGPNRRSDTPAVMPDDTQTIAVGAACLSEVDIAVTGGPDGLQSLDDALQSNDAGPVRNNEQDQTGYEDSNGPSGDRIQFAFEWIIIEGAAGNMGFTVDDIVFEWDETHPVDQVSAENSCADICIGGSNDGEACSTGCAGGECATGAGFAERRNEPGSCIDRCVGGSNAGTRCTSPAGAECLGGGTCPFAGVCITGNTNACGGMPADCISAARQCATISVDRMSLLDCNAPLLVTVQDPKTGSSVSVDQVVINARSNGEPFGEEFVLTETTAASHAFQGLVPVSTTFNSAGTVFILASGQESVVISYADPHCDLDGPLSESDGIGRLGETDFTDIDGDGVLSLGINGLLDSRQVGDFDDDNCFDADTGTDVYNPAQADSDTFCANELGESNGTFCAAGVGPAGNAFCAGVNVAFPTCRPDRAGDLCDVCPDDYNPGQEDSDGDGVGDVCELDYNPGIGCQDLDFDLVCNTSDNCPSTANPGQQDADANGVGDACDGGGDGDLDTIPDGADNCPGVPNFQQQDSDRDGIGDDCESFVEDFDADGVLDILDNCPLVFNPADGLGSQADSDRDGVGDPCDFDPDNKAQDGNNDGVPDDLVQFFVTAQCNPDLGNVSILAVDIFDDPSAAPTSSGDGDGFPDEGETIVLDLTIRNGVTDPAGAPLDLTNVAVGISSTSPSVACVLDATAIYGDLPSGAENKNPASDRFSFVVGSSQSPQGTCNGASTNAGVLCLVANVGFCLQDVDVPDLAECEPSLAAQTRALTDVRTATFTVTVAADQISGRVSAASFTLTLDLDIIGDTTGGGPLDGTGQMCEDFEAIVDPDGDPSLGANATSELTDTFLGHRDPGVNITDIIPVVPGAQCGSTSLGTPDCSVNTTVNDWHLHSFSEEPGNAPGGDQAHGGDKSLHMGRHLNPGNPLNSTYRLQQLTAFLSPPVNIALSGNRALEFWHIVRLADETVLNLLPGRTFDMAMLQVRLDGDTDPLVDDFGDWQRLEPLTNPYDHRRDAVVVEACKLDPADDFLDVAAGGSANETTCAPQSGWSDQGEGTGSGASPGGGAPCIDADGNGHNDCGSANTVGPGFSETGSVGTGTWIKTRFDLGPFRGRRLQVRWLFSSIGLLDEPDFLSYNESPGQQDFDLREFDDGWFLDDICFSGLINNQLNVIPDGGDDEYDSNTETVTCGENLLAETFAEFDDVQTHSISPAGGLNLCATTSDIVVSAGANLVIDSVASDFCPTNPLEICTTVTALINDRPSPLLASVLFAGQLFTLDGSASSADVCVGGSLEYQFVECNALTGACDWPVNGSLVKGFSTSPSQAVAPLQDTRYAMEVRCSSLLTCNDMAFITVLAADPRDCGLITLNVSGANPTILSAQKPTPVGVALDYDAGVAADLGTALVTLGTNLADGFAAGTSPGTMVANVEDSNVGPTLGVVRYYLVSCDLPAPKPAGKQRIDRVPVARFQSP